MTNRQARALAKARSEGARDALVMLITAALEAVAESTPEQVGVDFFKELEELRELGTGDPAVDAALGRTS